jgi:hypothetical protein
MIDTMPLMTNSGTKGIAINTSPIIMITSRSEAG